ncbi:hypothetical protein RB195_007054 [Necator americanus]|uniref:Uncharacterized protein n=1 Tax=Necator americanus TaxID=51031 RepID=A0ABR1BYA5_NECAM
MVPLLFAMNNHGQLKDAGLIGENTYHEDIAIKVNKILVDPERYNILLLYLILQLAFNREVFQTPEIFLRDRNSCDSSRKKSPEAIQISSYMRAA